MAVSSLEFRHRLMPVDNFMSRLARPGKETSEAKDCRCCAGLHAIEAESPSENKFVDVPIDPELTAPG